MHLSTLALSRTKVTDKGLMELVALKELRRVELDYTRVTTEGRLAFSKQRKDVTLTETPKGPMLPGG